jgi:hypothetical protein
MAVPVDTAIGFLSAFFIASGFGGDSRFSRASRWSHAGQSTARRYVLEVQR